MGFLAQEELASLQERAKAWNTYSGPSYFASSKMGLNQPRSGSNGEYEIALLRNFDTSHDITDPVQFMDHMDSRGRQAQALADELRDWRELCYQYPDFYKTTEGSALLYNYSRRATMALYGVDEVSHRSQFEHCAFETGEWPYNITEASFRNLMTGDYGTGFDNLDSVIERLESFSDNWLRVANKENLIQSLPSWASDKDPETKVSLLGKDYVIKTPGMAYRYAAEVLGKGRYFERIDAQGPEFYGMRFKSKDPYVTELLSSISCLTKLDTHAVPDFNQTGHSPVSSYLSKAFALDGESVYIRGKNMADDAILNLHDKELESCLRSPCCDIPDDVKLSRLYPGVNLNPDAGSSKPDKSAGRNTSDLDAEYDNLTSTGSHELGDDTGFAF